MSSTRPSANTRRARQSAGFTLIELMVGVMIGLLATLAVTQVLVKSEGQKRTTTSGSDAQINGALALATLQRTIQSAGYGFGALPAVIGCPITASYGGAIAGLPTKLVPFEIIDGGADGTPDKIRVISSGKKTFSVPLRIVAPGPDAASSITPVASTRGLAAGDLLIAARDAVTACELVRIDTIDSAKAEVTAEGAFPAAAFPEGDFVLNMGSPLDITYSVVPADATRPKSLYSKSLDVDNTGKSVYTGEVELFPNIVNLQALYGKDTDGDGAVNKWDLVAPLTNADWRQVLAVRIAVVARSTQYEKEDVTTDNLDWDVGKNTVVDDSTGATVDCGPDGAKSKCLKLVVNTLADWKRYRYRVYDTVIPLRNMLWNS
jgi:type IV pilus assembly protein PilW